MTDLNPQVQGSETGGVAEQVTPETQGGVSQVETPVSQTPVDVEALKADYEKKLAASQQDLNKLKSSLQQREAQIVKDSQQKYSELQRQLHEVRMSTMDDDARKKYEAQLVTEEYQSLQEQMAEINRKNQEYQSMLDAQQFFLNKGVPADRLVLNQGYEVLVESGWNWVTERLQAIQNAASNPTTKSEPAPLRQAPNVVTDKATPHTGTTWSDLLQKYGTAENVYRAVEEGRLPASIIPG